MAVKNCKRKKGSKKIQENHNFLFFLILYSYDTACDMDFAMYYSICKP